jgi:hypothetical protein
MGHLSDGRNYTLSHVGEPEIFISDELMKRFIEDEVVAEMVAVRLLKERKYTNYASGLVYSQDYIKEICSLNHSDPQTIIDSVSNRINKAVENILDG